MNQPVLKQPVMAATATPTALFAAATPIPPATAVATNTHVYSSSWDCFFTVSVYIHVAHHTSNYYCQSECYYFTYCAHVLI